jgi:predicted nuclease of predicted toxin-antitoxin system
MRLKLDENLGAGGRDLLAARGHDVATVSGQSLCAADDHTVLAVCKAESRALITLDLDFANPLAYPPASHVGVAVLRVPHRLSAGILHELILTLAESLEREDLKGRLWIVEKGRIRVYQPQAE